MKNTCFEQRYVIEEQLFREMCLNALRIPDKVKGGQMESKILISIFILVFFLLTFNRQKITLVYSGQEQFKENNYVIRGMQDKHLKKEEWILEKNSKWQFVHVIETIKHVYTQEHCSEYSSK